MNNKLVKIEGRDYYLMDESGKYFFCRACLRTLPLKDMSSKDARYCGFCQEIVEAEYLIRAESRQTTLAALYKPVKRALDAEKAGTKNIQVDNQGTLICPNGRGAKKRQDLPEDLIIEMDRNGKSSRVISEYLNISMGIEVSYRTIQRITAGRRKQPEQLRRR